MARKQSTSKPALRNQTSSTPKTVKTSGKGKAPARSAASARQGKPTPGALALFDALRALAARRSKVGPAPGKRCARTPRALRKASASVRLDLVSSLREINKFIFVQDFERASRLLKRLSQHHPGDSEVQFRRIEVACRTEEIDAVRQEFSERAARMPNVLALQLAASLAEIRTLEHTEEDNGEDELINPSLSGGSAGARRDVVGLSEASERMGAGRVLNQLAAGRGGAAGSSGAGSGAGLASLQDVRAANQSRSVYGSIGASLGGRTSRVNAVGSNASPWRVVRNPSVADDAIPNDVPPLEDAFADEAAVAIAGSAFLGPDQDPERQRAPAVMAARRLSAANPDNYAAWYVLGCASEFVGDLSRAVDAWTKALSLNPESVAVLSALSELQQIGALSQESEDYTQRFEGLDPYLVHGTYETHMNLHREYLARGEYTLAISALRTLADWIQRQRGEVPAEIKAVSLFGAMKAYRLAGHHTAAEVCRREGENIVVAAKKGGESPTQLAFMGQMAEEYALVPLARMCYFAVLTSGETSEELAVRTAAHAVSAMPSHALKEVLHTAYLLHKGHSELRFCLLLCALAVAGVPAKRYMDRRSKARTLFLTGDTDQAYALLTECANESDEDAEVQRVLGEIQWRKGDKDAASAHYARMYWLDSLNADFALRFVSHLVRIGEFSRAEQVAMQAMDIPTLGSRQLAELHWVRATGLNEAGHEEDARIQMNKALAADPWNAGYLALALRLLTPSDRTFLPHEDVVARYEDWNDRPGKTFPEDLAADWLERAEAALCAGFVEYAWTMARALFLHEWRQVEAAAFFSRAGAAWNSRAATQQTMLFLQKEGQDVSFATLATVVARIYGWSGEWALVDEWIDIALKAGAEDRHLRSRLFELEALSLTLQGVKLPRALSLVEAAIDVYEGESRVPADTGMLQGYLMVAQGDLNGGLDKMRTHLTEDASIQSLYFLVKALQRTGRLKEGGDEQIARLYKLVPTNSLEQKLMEEIFTLVGVRKAGSSVHLAS